MDERESTPAVTRRQALRAGAGTAVGLATIGVAGTGATSAQTDAYGGFLSEAEWDGGTVDASGVDELVVNVGAGDGFQFQPPAIYVDPGTTVVWTWTGQGGGHNVLHDPEIPLNDADEPVFDSRETHDGSTMSDPGFTYEFTFEEGTEGVHQYVCTPHRSLQMKGVVVVGEENVETDLISVPSGDSGLAMGPVAAGGTVFGAVTLIGVAAYRELTGQSTE